jgi:membrane-bound serine protease (ClpP class)
MDISRHRRRVGVASLLLGTLVGLGAAAGPRIAVATAATEVEGRAAEQVAGQLAGQFAGQGPVHVLRIDGEIDLGLAALTERAVTEATEAGASALVLRIDTPGGRLDAALRMRDVLLGAQVMTVAFVDRDAFSAGALVAIAAERLHLAPGAVLGAATPVLGDGRQADEKTVSAVRAVFRATALERGRDPAVAEAMVDPALVVDGLVRRGELLTLDVTQAQQVGYADGVDVDLAALLVGLDLAEREVVEVRPALAERLVRVLTSGIVAGLLLTVGIWLLVGDVLGGGGLGLGAALGSAAIATFLFGHLLAGLAGWESVVLVVLGIVLILVEVLVLPGIGIAGVSGVLALLGGAVLAMVDRQVEVVPSAVITRAVSIVGASFLAAVVLIAVVLSLASRKGAMTRQGSRLVLRSDVGGAHDAPLLGATGVALTDLHPSGAVTIDDARIDVVAEEGFIAAGTTVVVIIDEGYRRVVRARRDDERDVGAR